MQRIQQNPRNVSFDELRSVLEDYGFVLDRSRGSHNSFVGKIRGSSVLITIPFNQPLKSIYVKQALVLIDQIEDATGTDEDDE